MSYIEQAKKLRPIIEEASKSLADDVAIDAAELFPKWSDESVEYKVNDRVQYDGVLYRCVQDHTSQNSWTPAAAHSLWALISDPTQEYPEWIQPTGAHDAYSMGDKVSHNEKHWISDINANVYEPGVYGWTEV